MVGEVHRFDLGKFAHIRYLEDNRIELWEPFDEAYGDMVEGKSTS